MAPISLRIKVGVLVMTGRVLLPDLLICSCFPPLSPLRLPSVSLARPNLRAASPNSVPTSPMWRVTHVGQCTGGVFPPSQTVLLDRAALRLYPGWKALSKDIHMANSLKSWLCSNATFSKKPPAETTQFKISPHNLVPYRSFLLPSLCSIFSIALNTL